MNRFYFHPLPERAIVKGFRDPLSYLSEEQEELKRKLSKELERLIQRDYSGHY